MDLTNPRPERPGPSRGSSRPAGTPGPADPSRLDALLRETFGHGDFRPHQRGVCEALVAGHDVLLVMPTGAGKSLCYQLPALAREGAALVISPLIALMEDQVAKLREAGLAAGRVHSGLSRQAQRDACRAWLDGGLQFLFVAPERLGVPGFPELLARRKPGLVAVDEAHCISEWGHDFRPDYRRLRERLPSLRPAPVAALTATATPAVQRDIVEQLGMPDALRFIHGFRRDNLAVEVVELRPGRRIAAVERLLDEPAARPAIVYAPTRKQTDELADTLGAAFPAAAYHAGLSAARRDEVQVAFLEGRLEVVVATIAFGMGIDKADVRTVIHTALPGSLEGYYQEIGRAGRDGEPSRAVLLYGWSDRRTHEFFLERDWPDPGRLERVQRSLDAAGTPRDAVLPRLDPGDPDEAERLLGRLVASGAGLVGRDGLVRRGDPRWREGYERQRGLKREQLDRITRFAGSRDCRMRHLVTYFGDEDGRACGRCDICDPASASVLAFRVPGPHEQHLMGRLLDALRQRDGPGTGRLFRGLAGHIGDRDQFERLLDGLARAGLVIEREASFVRDGERIDYRRVWLTPEGREARELSQVQVAMAVERAGGGRSRRRQRPAAGPAPVPAGDAGEGAPPELVESLRAWRREEARRREVPAYCVLTDRALRGVAARRPASVEELLEVHGVGPVLAERYGEELVRLVGPGGVPGSGPPGS